MDTVLVKKNNRLLSHFSRQWQLWLMVLPALAIILVFNYIPMYGIQLAFREFDFTKGLTGGEFVGFKYFQQFFESPMFQTVIVNTLRISVTTLIFGFIAPILLALIINQIRNPKEKSHANCGLFTSLHFYGRDGRDIASLSFTRNRCFSQPLELGFFCQLNGERQYVRARLCHF
ncbi:MAG: hypothetical protein ACLSIL_20000 [Enterococcus casseliflavus]